MRYLFLMCWATVLLAQQSSQLGSSGLDARYYEGIWKILPEFDAMEPVWTGVAQDISLKYAKVKDNFALVFEGYLHIEKEGDYTFRLASDDGSRFWLDNILLIDNDGLHGNLSKTGKARLMQGLHPIKVEYFEQGGNEVLALTGSGPDFDGNIPASSLFRSKRLQPGLTYDYFQGDWKALPIFGGEMPFTSGIAGKVSATYCQRKTYCGLTFSGYLEIPKSGNYTFVLGSDDGSDLWIDDKQLINNDGLHSYAEKEASQTLTAGFHKIRLRYFQGVGDATLTLKYAGPDLPQQEIPESAYFHEVE